MLYKLLYHPDIPKLDLTAINRGIQARIRKAIEKRLSADPIHYGEPLRRSLKGFRKMRVGDYRVIYEICGSEIRIYAIGHRKEIYESPLRSWITPKK